MLANNMYISTCYLLYEYSYKTVFLLTNKNVNIMNKMKFMVLFISISMIIGMLWK